ncbi:hypothetical protein LINPERPRIM_LOCUS15959, partial [Linum perenne]
RSSIQVRRSRSVAQERGLRFRSVAQETVFDSGPSLKVAYRPNDSWIPFSFVVKTGTRNFGSPISSPMVMSAEFNLIGNWNGNPSFMLHFKPRLGISIRSGRNGVVNSSPDLNDGWGIGSRLPCPTPASTVTDELALSISIPELYLDVLIRNECGPPSGRASLGMGGGQSTAAAVRRRRGDGGEVAARRRWSWWWLWWRRREEDEGGKSFGLVIVWLIWVGV